MSIASTRRASPVFRGTIVGANGDRKGRSTIHCGKCNRTFKAIVQVSRGSRTGLAIHVRCGTTLQVPL